MNTKIQKLISLYKDKSITIEEKRSIAVKLVDMGVLQVSASQHSGLGYEIAYMKLKQDFLELEREYKGVSKRCDMITRDNLDSFKNERLLESRVSELLTENNKLKSARKWLTISLIINAVVIIIKILN